jgi:hypothetical protein
VGDGIVLKLDPNRLDELKMCIDRFPEQMELAVRNRTYEVVRSQQDQALAATIGEEEAEQDMRTLDPRSTKLGGNSVELPAFRAQEHYIAEQHCIHYQQDDDGTADESADAERPDEAYGSNSSKYFNTRVHVTNNEHRILAYLISGIRLITMREYVKGNIIEGLNPCNP